MKILIISKYARVPKDGAPTRHYYFAKFLNQLGNDVLLINSRSSFSRDKSTFFGFFKTSIDSGLKILTINGFLISRGFGIKRLYTWITFEVKLFIYLFFINKKKYDVILVSSLSLLTILNGLLYKKLFKTKLVFEVRDIYPLTLVLIGKMGVNNPLIKLLDQIETLAYNNSDLIISSLENLHDHIKSKGISNFNFRWLPTGFDKSNLNFNKEYSNNVILSIQESKSNGNFVIGYAGTIGKANALENLLLAISRLYTRKKPIQLFIIGDGPLKQFFIEKYSKFNNIIFFDFIEKKNLAYTLSFFDLLINTWEELEIYKFGISPNKWLDYMGSKRPILLVNRFESKIFNEANFGWRIYSNLVGDLENEILRISRIPRRELDKKGNNGYEYLTKHLDYHILTRNLNSWLHEIK